MRDWCFSSSEQSFNYITWKTSYLATFQQHLHMSIYCIYVSYYRACGSYHNFCDRELLLMRKPPNHARIPSVKIERHYRWSWIFPVRRCHSYVLISSLMTNKSNISMVLWTGIQHIHYQHIKKRKYHTVGTFPKPNRKFVEKGTKCTHLTHKYMTYHFPGLVQSLQ